jgi:DNA uptake protein ComE-like DNA-binding protein
MSRRHPITSRKMPRHPVPRRAAVERCALVLVIVLVAVAMLSLAAYTFSELMLTEHQGARVVSRQSQARELVNSGGALLQYYLQQTPDLILQAGGTYDNAGQFSGLLVTDDGTPRGRGRISIIAPKIENGNVTGVRFGLENESTRLNVNAFAQWEQQQPGSAHQLLMTLPGMDDATADAILDWVSPASAASPDGAEADYYSSLTPPYAPTNGPIATIEELLKVRGVTPQLLFGADANRNGMIDPGEEANAQLASNSGADPEMNRGWAAYLTVHGREANVQSDGTPKINVNGNDLQQLHDDLSAALDNDEWVNFILAYRLYGGSSGQQGGQQGGQSAPQGGQGGQQGQQGGKGGSSGGQPGGTPMGSLFGTRKSPFQFVALQLPVGGGAPGGPAGGGSGGGGRAGAPGGTGPGAGGPGPGAAGGKGGPGPGGKGGQGQQGGKGGSGQGGKGGRAGAGPGGGGGKGGKGPQGGFGQRGGKGGGAGGRQQGGGGAGKSNSAGGTADEVSATDVQLDLTQKPKATIDSLLDLIGATVQVPKPNPTGGANNNATQTVRAAFPADAMQAGQYLPELLDHLTTNKATSFPGRININQASKTILLGIPGMTSDMVDSIISAREPEYTGQKPDQKYETWLYTEGIVTLDQFKAMWPFITTGGSVYRAQIVGYFDEGGPAARVEAIIDTSPPSTSASQTASTSSSSSSGSSGDSSSGSTSQTSASSTSSSQTSSSSQSTTDSQATTSLPRIVFWRDLSNLGRGFPLETLGSGASQ